MVLPAGGFQATSNTAKADEELSSPCTDGTDEGADLGSCVSSVP